MRTLHIHFEKREIWVGLRWTCVHVGGWSVWKGDNCIRGKKYVITYHLCLIPCFPISWERVASIPSTDPQPKTDTIP